MACVAAPFSSAVSVVATLSSVAACAAGVLLDGDSIHDMLLGGGDLCVVHSFFIEAYKKRVKER
jgi:drug/metabolite transporter (DMT)-like permease